MFNINDQCFQIKSVAYKQFIKGFRMNKMDIQCPFEYLACVQNALWLAERPQRHYDGTAYKHTVALASFVEINKQINAKFIL